LSVTSETTSLTQHVESMPAGEHVLAAAFLGDAPALVLTDGTILVGGPGESRRVAAHPDAAILVATGDGKQLITGGDDGRVVATAASGESPMRKAAGSTP
jgi:hypothetical protein